ncbi:hypothetical protein F5Y19DRAFT_52977 [Xylariaceae sp. FL1651]|nr:hypothetical protein F5Y19DRAFT_52977 [Xylariaceae sp. FL1651]
MEFGYHSHPLVLSNLPTEILILILGNFCLHCREPGGVPHLYFPKKQRQSDQPSWHSLDLQALYATCLVSKTLCGIAQSILYHEFIPGYSDSGQSRQYEWIGRLESFLWTVSLRPDLASLVRGLYLSYWLLQPIWIYNGHVEALLEELARIRGINLSNFLKPFHDLPIRKLLGPYRPSADELIAMLLASLPNLDRRYITSLTPRSPIPVAALSAAGARCFRLQTIEICASGSNVRDRLGCILEDSLPTLTTLNIDSFCSSDGDKLGFSELFFPRLRNIGVLVSRMSGPDLEQLLSYCTGLETFTYDAISTLHCIKPSGIVESLRRYQQTLRTMRLDLRAARLIDERFLPELIPTLENFSALLNVSLNDYYCSPLRPYNTGEHNKLGQRHHGMLPVSFCSCRL